MTFERLMVAKAGIQKLGWYWGCTRSQGTRLAFPKMHGNLLGHQTIQSSRDE
jgi:hypothetical protein